MLGIGNNFNAFAYSLFGISGDVDLTNNVGGFLLMNNSVHMFVARIDYASGADDTVTVWMDPDISVGEGSQGNLYRRTFTGNARFNRLALRSGSNNNDNSWDFDEIRFGAGWSQVTAELAYERSGPERFLSSMGLLKQIIVTAGSNPSERVAIALGRLTARLHALRRLSLSVAVQLQSGENPALEAALVKDIGAIFEQEIPDIAHDLFGLEANQTAEDAMRRVQAYLTQVAPSFSLRGGTREILRGIIARGLGLR